MSILNQNFHYVFILSSRFEHKITYYFYSIIETKKMECKIYIPFPFVNVNTQRSPNLSKNAFLHFAQMHPLVFVCFDTLLSLCSKKSH
ncbi:hypothetical protein CLONEX_00215 [[Clostridium] nexile DSM 1787]|nr:hypothetical protein CLONEX_00215 [[Clostridium] nexile DSM 1787]